MFEAVPGLYLVLSPDFRIVACSDSYLHATRKKREDIVGCSMFEVFPDNPQDEAADGVRNLRASFEKVIEAGVPNQMRLQRYDVEDKVSEKGEWIEKYWSPSNYPIFGNGSKEVAYLIHRVEDMTPAVEIGRDPQKERLIKDSVEIHARRNGRSVLRTLEEVEDAERNTKNAWEKLECLRGDSWEVTDRALAQLESSATRGIRLLQWQRPYFEALREERAKVSAAKFRRAEWAVHWRLMELSILGDFDSWEWNQLQQARRNLQNLKPLV